MKFSIQRDEFFAALQKVVSVIPQRSTIAMTQNILLSASGNQLELTTTDLEITMISHITADISKEGEIAIPGRIINDIVRELPNGNLSFESNENFRCQLKSDFGKYKIGGENPAEFPQKPELATGKEVILPNDVLKRLIEKTIFATSTDELRPALTGVFFSVGAHKIKTVATDGHRLATYDYEDEALPEEAFTAIVSKRALGFVTKALEGEGLTATTFGEQHALFHMENTKLFARLIEDNYVDYNRIIPAETNFTLSLSTKDFLASAKRVSLFSNPITAQVVISLGKEIMQIEAEDIDYGGEAKEEIPCEFSGDEFVIGFNSRYLQTILRHLDSETAMIDLVRPDYAIIVKPDSIAENETQLMLIMPIRLENF